MWHKQPRLFYHHRKCQTSDCADWLSSNSHTCVGKKIHSLDSKELVLVRIKRNFVFLLTSRGILVWKGQECSSGNLNWSHKGDCPIWTWYKLYLISKRYHLKEARLPGAVQERSPRYRHSETGLKRPAKIESKSGNTRLFNNDLF